MNKLFKTAASVLAGAAIIVSQSINFMTGGAEKAFADAITADDLQTVDVNYTAGGGYQYAEPLFRISAVETSEINAGQSGSFKLNIKNLGSVDAERILVEVSCSDDIILTDGCESQDINYILADSTKQIKISYKALGKINSEKQPFNITLHYYYDSEVGEAIGTSSATVNLMAKLDEPADSAPIKVTTNDKNEIVAGEEGFFTINVKNIGSEDVTKVFVDTTTSEDIILSEDSVSQEAIGIIPNSSLNFTIRYTALEKLSDTKQNFEIKIRYKSNGEEGELTHSVSIPVKEAEDLSPTLKMFGQTDNLMIEKQSEYEYTLTVRNYGSIAVSNVNLFFDASDSLYFIDGTETASIAEIPANTSAQVKVKFRTSDTISSIKQSIGAHITYSYAVGKVIKNAETDSSVTVIANIPKEEEKDDPVEIEDAAPNIIIKSYDIGAEQIAAGDSFDLNVTFLNTSSVTGVENIILTVNAGGSINIFGGTNTFYYSQLGAGGTISETIPLKTLATAETGTATISLNLKYDYISKDDRQTSNTEQTIFVPVFQPDKMSFEVAVPTYSITVGSEAYVTTTYINKGRSEISNVKAEIVGDVGALSTSKVIGTVQPGGNGSFDFIITPYMAGMCEFTIKITYDDATLEEVVKEYPVSFPVEEMYDPGWIEPDPGWGDDPIEPEQSGFPWVILWIGIGVLVVGGVVTLIIVLNIKKKKKKALTEADINWEDEFDDAPRGSGNSNNSNSNNNDNNKTTV